MDLIASAHLCLEGAAKRMAGKFHERFGIEVGLEEAKKYFVNRLHGLVFDRFLNSISEGERYRIRDGVIIAIGEKPRHLRPLTRQIGDNFEVNLRAVEALFNALHSPRNEDGSHYPYFDDSYSDYRNQLTSLITQILNQSEIDLSIFWQNGRFVRTGAAFLDEQLVNYPLHWLSEPQYKTVLTPFRKALDNFQHATQRPSLLSDVITDMYEALEALAKIITERPGKDLSANREMFVAKVEASDDYKKLLKDYIDYANRFRHAARESQPRPELSPKEVESFVYLTGVFIRLSI